MKDIYEWMQSINDNAVVTFITIIITIGSAFGSIKAICVTRQLKKKLNTYYEKRRFENKKDELINQLQGFHTSIFVHNIYGESILNSIIELIDIIKINYNFLDKETRKCINDIYCFITSSCLPEVKKFKQDSKYSLCREINKLIEYLDKEDVLI